MDAYSGYNQTLIYEVDKEQTFFVIEMETYCYKVIIWSEVRRHDLPTHSQLDFQGSH